MNINVNSTQINDLLKLNPMAVPGAEENLQPPGAYHLGIPESIHSPSTKLFMVIDPVMLFSSSLAIGDSVRLWVNDQATSVIETVKPGKENDRIWMELPWGWLVDGLNTLHYEVTEVSGNKDKSDPILKVLFNNPVSGITVSHPASIGPGQPATFTFTRSKPREYDVLTLTVGTWRKTIPYVHPSNPVTYTLTATDLQQIGDGTHQVYAKVVDQLSNSNVSPTTSITITAKQKVYNPPIIVEAEANKRVLDVPALAGKNATIHALTWTDMVPDQPCWLELLGFKPDGTVHNLKLWNGFPARSNPSWISLGRYVQTVVNSYLAQLGDGTKLTVQFSVSEDKSNDPTTATKFADQVYTINAVALIVPTIVNVNENTATGKPVANAGTTTALTLVISGKLSPGQQGELYDGSGATAKSLGKVTADAAGNYSITITVAQGPHRFYIQSLYHLGNPVYSNVWNLTVNTLAPLVMHISSGGLAVSALPYDWPHTRATNSVTISGQPSSQVTANLSGNARFSNASNAITVTLNSQGKAILPVSNTTAQTVSVTTAYATGSATTGSMTFSGSFPVNASAGIAEVRAHVASGAAADGLSPNRVTYDTLDINQSMTLNVQVSGSAYFLGYGGQVANIPLRRGTWDCTFDVVNTVKQTVTVTFYIASIGAWTRFSKQMTFT